MPFTPEDAKAIVERVARHCAAGTYRNQVKLPCHETDALVLQAQDTDESLALCLTCLKAYACSGATVVGPDLVTEAVVAQKCIRCQGEVPIKDFVTRSGWTSPYCGECRRAWGRTQHEKRKRALAVAEQEEQEEMHRARSRLRKVQRDLTEGP